MAILTIAIILCLLIAIGLITVMGAPSSLMSALPSYLYNHCLYRAEIAGCYSYGAIPPVINKYHSMVMIQKMHYDIWESNKLVLTERYIHIKCAEQYLTHPYLHQNKPIATPKFTAVYLQVPWRYRIAERSIN